MTNKKRTGETVEEIEGDLIPANLDDASKQQVVNTLVANLTPVVVDAHQLLGSISATYAIGTFIEATALKHLQIIKEEKLYRNLIGQKVERNGVIIELHTWEGYCRAIGSTATTINEKLDNLALLGEEAYKNAEQKGITTRALRGLRQLPEETQQPIIKRIEANIDDKEKIVDIIRAELAKVNDEKAEAKKQLETEKEALEKQLKASQEDAEATGKVIAKKNEKIDQLEKQIVKRENMTLDEQVKALYHELQLAEVGCLSPLVQMASVLDRVVVQANEGLEQRAATLLMNVRNHLDDLFRQYQLEQVEVNRELDDSWAEHIGDDDEDQPQLPLN